MAAYISNTATCGVEGGVWTSSCFAVRVSTCHHTRMNNLARKRLRTVAAFTLWGVVIGAVLGSVIGQFDGREPSFSALRGVAVGILIGAGLGLGEEFILPRWSRAMAFARLSVAEESKERMRRAHSNRSPEWCRRISEGKKNANKSA